MDDTHSGKEIDEYTTSLIESLFQNNSRLISASNEIYERNKGLSFNESIELKDGKISIDEGRTLSISGYCLGALVHLKRNLHESDSYEFTVRNVHPLFEVVEIDAFTLKSFLGISIDDDNQVQVNLNGEYALNYLEGSMDLFLKWYRKAMKNRFPMSKVNNPIARFLY